MTRLASLGRIAILAASLIGCQDDDLDVPLRSLANSGDVTYVCRTFPEGVGVPLHECHPASISGGGRELVALVTQQSTGEVAAINVPLDSQDQRDREGVVDLDPSSPGYAFLRVGARPGDIVSTPGGQASFVGVAEPGKAGIFGLPTSCLDAPRPGETMRDLTSWPACSLPRDPGQILMVVDPPTADGTIFESCDRSLGAEGNEPASSVRSECRANLTTEGGARGRRKLVVALPDAGSIAVIDAQWLLDREPGSFEPCRIEAEYALRVELPATPISQRVPADLAPPEGCTPSVLPSVPVDPVFAPRPSSLDWADGILYVGDEAAPVIHRLEIGSPCSATEIPPLLPRSFLRPDRMVTTSEVAVSPLTSSGQRFVYAVDVDDQPLSSLMVFDVSADSTDRTPLLRPNAGYLPNEAPDRLRFGGAIRDIAFVERERPELNRETGSAISGTLCNPNPIVGASGTEYQRPVILEQGALAEDLRGIFGLVLLSSAQIGFVDLDDYNAPCRRPIQINTGDELDFRGCAGDRPEIPGLTRYHYGFETPETTDDFLSVTNEVSCQMVRRHEPRSSFRGLTNDQVGVHAPSLRSFPQLAVPESAKGAEPESLPRLLAVDFPAPGGGVEPAQVYVGTTLYRRDQSRISDSALIIDPATAQQPSLALPFLEPRAYSGQQQQITYEGALTGHTSAFFTVNPDGVLVLTDPTVGFCDTGVRDPELMRQLGATKFELDGERLQRFTEQHTDHVAVTADFPKEDDGYWSGLACARAECVDAFGEWNAEVLSDARKFRVLDATQGEVLLSPRVEGIEPELVRCCFPGGSRYEIRASRHWVLRGGGSSARHDLVAEWTRKDGKRVLECVEDCSPLKRFNDSRVFEITCPPGAAACAAGATQPGDPCEISAVRDGGARPTGVLLDEPAARCIRDTPTERFAIYRGRLATQPATTFGWSVTGTFSPLGIDLGILSRGISPSAAVSLREFDWLSVVDSASSGLIQVDLDTLSVEIPIN